MDSLYSLLDELKKSINDLDCVKHIRKVQLKMLNDGDLISKLREYRLYNNPKIKDEIIKNEDVILYKHLENQVNYVILSINKSLNEIVLRDNEEKI